MTMNSAPKQEEVMLEVNMTPLIDVMLVLIIMFIITIPIQNDAVNINMPTQAQTMTDQPPEVVQISIQSDGGILWNSERLQDSAELEQRLKLVAAKTEQDQVQIRPESQTAYKDLVMVMAAAQRLGVKNMGIVQPQG
ncbi:outer membrane transport energization protein ExbD [Acinetobacter calcoaceticus]|uniref:Outer membrane transport energization protein ExbD n=1 Tax=Acinetobacter calcoaceticus TaxID=471 RepID=A0A4R1XT78_ACICA|nr:outer membrane transport energization protein ExbD [Acinetobacter calcoaceticus]